MADLIREIECPRCQGTMTVVDKELRGDGWTKLVVDRVVCHNGCGEFAPEEIPQREKV